MVLQTYKRPQRAADVVALRVRVTHRGPLHPAILLQPSMVLLDPQACSAFESRVASSMARSLAAHYSVSPFGASIRNTFTSPNPSRGTTARTCLGVAAKKSR